MQKIVQSGHTECSAPSAPASSPTFAAELKIKRRFAQGCQILNENSKIPQILNRNREFNGFIEKIS